MKTAVSIPDELFSEADALAHRLNISRSALYASALRALLARDRAVTDALDEIYRSVRPDPAVTAAAKRTFERNRW